MQGVPEWRNGLPPHPSIEPDGANDEVSVSASSKKAGEGSPAFLFSLNPAGEPAQDSKPSGAPLLDSKPAGPAWPDPWETAWHPEVNTHPATGAHLDTAPITGANPAARVDSPASTTEPGTGRQTGLYRHHTTASYAKAEAVAGQWGVPVDDSTRLAQARRLGAMAEARTQKALKSPPSERQPQRAPTAWRC